MGRGAVVGALLIMLAGCSLDRETSPGPPTGVLRGDVLAGPTCPVESTNAVNCEPAPVGGTVQVWQGDANVGEVSIRVDGTFRMDIPSGEYDLKVVTSDATGPLVCEDSPVTIVAGAASEVHLRCDTGIR